MNLSVGNRCSVRSGGIPFDLRWTLLVCPSFVTRDMLWSSASLLLSVAVAWESLQYCRMREVTTSWRTTAGSNSGMIFQRFVDGIMPGHDQGCLERSLFGEGSWNCPALTCPSPFHALPEMCATCRSSSDPVRTQTSQSPVALSPPRDSVRFSVCRVAAEILRILGQAPLNGQTPAQVSKQNLGRISRQCCLELSQLIVFDTAAVNSQTGSGRGLHYAFRAMVLQDLARHMPTGQ